jgi:mono/diheme cytochrome c family protein
MRRILGAALAMGAALIAFWALSPHLPAAERGRRIAQRTGCFACHVREGHGGAGNPGRKDREVPNFADDLMMYAKSRSEIMEWIRDGVTRAKAGSASWKSEREHGALRMPAFGARLGARQIADLASYVEAVAGTPEPPDSLAKRGLERAGQLGCTGCHGDGGRLSRPNPGSLKGYVPSWDGADWPELVKSRAEFEEWVKRGRSRRFERLPLAAWFLERAVLRMPAYERHLEPGDLDALWAYVEWLRGASAERAGKAPPAAGESGEVGR